RTIGIDQLDLNIRRKVRRHPLHAVRTYTLMTVADAARELSNIRRSHRRIDQEKIVAAGAGLHKRDGTHAGIQSRSTRPREVALPRMVEVFSSRRNSFCSRLQPSTSN